MFGKKIIKRCPKGHEMELDWRRCPRCTGRSSLHEGRDITEATVVLGPHAAPADETRIVSPSLSGGTRAPGAAPAASPAATPAVQPGPLRPSASAGPAPAAPAAEPQPLRRARLECTAGPLAGTAFPLEQGVYRFGKAPDPGGGMRVIAIPADRFLSKNHALLTVGTAQIVLSDPGSTNGTFVNGERVTRAILQDGDELRLGESFFRLTVGR